MGTDREGCEGLGEGEFDNRNRIEIMRPDPTLIFAGVAQPLTGRSIDVLRVLVLNEGRAVRKNEIAELHDNLTSAVGSKIRDLRDQLGPARDIVETVQAIGFQINLTGWTVDAHEFRQAIKSFSQALHDSSDQLITECLAREEIGKACLALALWNGNPAVDLRGSEHLEFEFHTLKVKTESHLLKARLLSGRNEDIKEAIQELQHRTRNEPDESTWMDLLLAHDALGSPAQITATVELILRCYGSQVPASLRDCINAIRDKRPLLNPYRRQPANLPGFNKIETGSDALEAHGDSLAELCTMLGITTASQQRLDGSLRPLSCLRRTRRRLYFSGILASKWVLEPVIRSEFDRLLTRLDEDNGDVRFLIIDPNSEGFQRLDELRHGGISTESVPPLLSLAAAHRSLQVRAYSSLPSFRIVIIDDDVVSFSPYRLAADVYMETDRGWEAPHVVLDPLAQYPLAEAFQLMFMETWANAKPLGEIE